VATDDDPDKALYKRLIDLNEPWRLLALRAPRDDGENKVHFQRSSANSFLCTHLTERSFQSPGTRNDRTRPEGTRQDALGHRRPAAWLDERRRISRDYMCRFYFCATCADSYEQAAQKELGRTTPTPTLPARKGDAKPPWHVDKAELRQMWPSSKSRCAASAYVYPSPTICGQYRPRWPRRSSSQLAGHAAKAFKYIEKSPSRATSRACFRRSTMAF